MAIKAAEMLFEALEKREARKNPVTLKVELVERGSVLDRSK
jgi:DNA-binding LacI/PurR family transcriptional regulator